MTKTVLIGSSNIYRPWDLLKDEEKSRITLQRCTKIETFASYMAELVKEDTKVIISVVENFVCDSVVSTERKDVEDKVTKTLDAFTEIVKTASTRLTETRFALVEPTERPGVIWYKEHFETLKREYSGRLTALGRINISVIKHDDLPTQLFDNDGVHLTAGMGLTFLNALIYFADQIFDASVVDLEEEETAMEIASGSDGLLPLTNKTTKPKTTEEQLMEVIADIEKRRMNDDLVFARIREELDFIVNSKKEDRIIIMGMTTDVLRPKGDIESRAWIRRIAEGALNAIIEGSGSSIQFVSPNRSVTLAVPVCEIKFRDRESAQKIRREFGKQRKEGRIDSGVFIANCVTLGTRVRLEVLKAIARKCAAPNNADMFVQGFTSRPVLQVKPKNGGEQSALTFVDAISRYGSKVKDADLVLAYERAGMSFVGQMRQNFVVLTDKGVRKGGRQTRGGGSAVPVVLTGANKRALEEGKDNGDEGAKRQAGGNWRGGSNGRGGRGGNHTPGKK